MKKIVSSILITLAVSVLFYSKLYQNRPIGPLVYIGVTPSGAPFSFYDEDNDLQGFDIDVAKLVSKKLNLSPEFVVKKSKKLVKDIEKGQIHLIAGLQKLALNQDYMDFSNIYLFDSPLETCFGISNQYGKEFTKQINDSINGLQKDITELQKKWHLI